MTSPIFLQDLPIEQLETLSKNDIQKISNAEQLYWNNKPHDITMWLYMALNLRMVI